MKLFQLAYKHWEEYVPYLFTHINVEKTIEEFKLDVDSLLTKYGEEFINSSDSWVGVDEWVKFIIPKMSELGYSPIDPPSYIIWGASILDSEDDISDSEWTEKVGDDLCQKAIAKNKEFYNQLEF